MKGRELRLEIDLKPALNEEQIDQRIRRDFEENRNRQFKNALGKLFPSKLIPVMVELSGIEKGQCHIQGRATWIRASNQASSIDGDGASGFQ